MESTTRYIVVMDNGMGQKIRFCPSKEDARIAIKRAGMDSPFADVNVFELPLVRLSYDDIWLD